MSLDFLFGWTATELARGESQRSLVWESWAVANTRAPERTLRTALAIARKTDSRRALVGLESELAVRRATAEVLAEERAAGARPAAGWRTCTLAFLAGAGLSVPTFWPWAWAYVARWWQP